MKKQIIEISQDFIVECDNPECDYKIENTTKDPFICTKNFIDMPCPKYGQNLLTKEDYQASEKFLNVAKWINRLFSWILIFIPKKSEVEENVIIHHHAGKVTIEIKEQENAPSCNGKCGMNYCDDNGCIERKRELVDPKDLNKTGIYIVK